MSFHSTKTYGLLFLLPISISLLTSRTSPVFPAPHINQHSKTSPQSSILLSNTLITTLARLTGYTGYLFLPRTATFNEAVKSAMPGQCFIPTHQHTIKPSLPSLTLVAAFSAPKDPTPLPLPYPPAYLVLDG